jgi:hypothetical protein
MHSTEPTLHRQVPDTGPAPYVDVAESAQVRCNFFPSLGFCCQAGTVFPFVLVLTTSSNVASREQVSNSPQVMTADSSFTTYNSVLSHYPFLSGHSLGPQETADMPNLRSLRMQTVAQRMTDNSLENARICQFEVPGGGECRDSTCGDMHLGQLLVEPNGTPHPVILCLFRHVIILSARRGVDVGND